MIPFMCMQVIMIRKQSGRTHTVYGIDNYSVPAVEEWGGHSSEQCPQFGLGWEGRVCLCVCWGESVTLCVLGEVVVIKLLEFW